MSRALMAMLALLLVASCAKTDRREAAPPPAERPTTMFTTFSDPAFAQVEPGSLLRSECSPEIDDLDFRGIVLRAPAEVRFVPGQVDPLSGTFAHVVICGTYALDHDTAGLNGDFIESIVFTAVDEANRRSYSGRMQKGPNAFVGPTVAETLGMDPADFAGRVLIGYFNPNLAEILALPATPAEYIVYAALGPYHSNTVRIRVVSAGLE